MTDANSKFSHERKKKRVPVALPIRVTYWEEAQKPVIEIACTYDISPRGARVTGMHRVKEKGEIVAVERGKNKAFCRVVWVGDPDSEQRGQIGIECVEPERTLWESELRDMENAYDPIVADKALKRSGAFTPHERRRRRERYVLEGVAEVIPQEKGGHAGNARLQNMSEIGCLVSTRQPLPMGTEVKLHLKVGGYDLTLKGQVRHCDATSVGIEFREVRKGDRQVLQFLMRKVADRHFEETLRFEVHR